MESNNFRSSIVQLSNFSKVCMLICVTKVSKWNVECVGLIQKIFYCVENIVVAGLMIGLALSVSNQLQCELPSLLGEHQCHL